MAIHAHRLASGPGWSVSDIVCTEGPRSRPAEERHEAVCIAAVTEGSFQYRCGRGRAVLGPGALLLGNEGECYECGHEHGVGDRCLAFHFAPAHFESILAEVPGARRLDFSLPRLPPLPSLMPLLAAAESARETGEGAWEELSVILAGKVASLAAGSDVSARRPSRRDERRVSLALRLIEAEADRPLSLATLAEAAATSPFHFLRCFRALVGMTPHQYLLRTRLHRAALRLRRSREPVSAIAFDAGFNDLSTFNRRFRRVMGASPSDFRRRQVRAA